MKHTTIILFLILLAGCQTYTFRANYDKENSLIHAPENIKTKPFLKAHLKNGDICIYKDTWNVDTISNLLTGYGTLYDFNRKLIKSETISIPLDSIAIFETNKKLENTESARIAALSVLTALDVILGLWCITVPKACFGSCPTFYTGDHANQSFHYADAEGFSSAILPSMEKSDIDAINQHNTQNGKFTVTMKNEALETHCIDNVKLMVFPTQENERVFQSPADSFYLCQNIAKPSKSTANEGDITEIIANDDKKERFSPADSNNLASKEEIIINFDKINSNINYGLIVDFRQSLMTTYLFYNTIAYMGDKASDIFAKIEKSDYLKSRIEAINRELGGIEVFTFNETKNNWQFQGTFNELGPIAINKQIIKLNNVNANNSIKIKLQLNKGFWRIDCVNLAEIVKQVEPQTITPTSILANGKVSPNALQLNNAENKYIISMPGNIFVFNFDLPQANQNYEMFLYSKGYYLEWMRNDWLKEKNISKLKKMYLHPKRYLKQQAKEYKRYENQMEEIFWNSKIISNQFSYEK